jgi:hypothetical protein
MLIIACECLSIYYENNWPGIFNYVQYLNLNHHPYSHSNLMFRRSIINHTIRVSSDGDHHARFTRLIFRVRNRMIGASKNLATYDIRYTTYNNESSSHINTDKKQSLVPLSITDICLRHEQLPFAYFFDEILSNGELELLLLKCYSIFLHQEVSL